jgi:hypothetical protein
MPWGARSKGSNIQRAALVLLMMIATASAILFFFVSWVPSSTFGLIAVMIFFMGNPIGAYWMLYRAFRYERKPGAYIALALIPLSFIWYYLERVRHSKIELDRWRVPSYSRTSNSASRVLSKMQRSALVLLMIVATLAPAPIFFLSWEPNTVELIALMTLSMGESIGGFWMIYRALRYERYPGTYIALALIPLSFIWYYLERVRHREIEVDRWSI